jgi:beta-glucosidase
VSASGVGLRAASRAASRVYHRVMKARLRILATLAVAAATATLASTAPPAAPKRLSSYDAEAKALLARMTLDEKIGQMTQAEQDKLADQRDIETYFLGSLLSGGDSDPKTNSLADWTEMYDRYQARALSTRLRIPILYGVDAVHGHNNVLGAVVFPHNIGLGATRDAKLVEEIGRITALEVKATGVQWAFAPCVAVVRDERWGRTYESFGEEPALVAELGAAAVRGLQGEDLKDPFRVLACAKHYVADGGTVWGSGKPDDAAPGKRFPLDQGDVRLGEAELKRIHMQGYVKAIEAGVASIMPSYSSWNGEKCSGSKRLLTEVLKGELGFEGFLISDYNAIDALPGDYRGDIRQSINAGMDMVMVPEKYREFFTTLKSLVEAREVPLARIDDAVTRILRVKLAMGLLDEGRSQLTDRKLHASFGSAEHRAVARRAVRQSLVLLKNEKRALPLSKAAKRIHLAGKSADDLAHQCGGWTIDWQGGSNASKIGGTTLLAALRSAAAQGAQVTYSKDGAGASGADVGVVVVGETPYAEFKGDRDDLTLAKEDLEAIATVKKAGIPVVVVLISGRPMILGYALAQADALVAAWLPGTEGQGVADVLFGDYKPTGKLSFTWPRSMSQIPINVGDKPYDPLFPYGFGLTY